MAEVYMVINKMQLLAFTMAIKAFGDLDDNAWGWMTGTPEKLQYFCSG